MSAAAKTPAQSPMKAAIKASTKAAIKAATKPPTKAVTKSPAKPPAKAVTKSPIKENNRQAELLNALPPVRGKLKANKSLADMTWFRTGGAADILFVPADRDDLQYFLNHTPSDIPITMLGAGSNTLVRDNGVAGITIKLGKAFADMRRIDNDIIHVGAAALDMTVARWAAKTGLSGLEFYSGIPGAIGGALRMNAGAYGRETADCFIRAWAFDKYGKQYELTKQDMGFTYRTCAADDELIFISAEYQTVPADKAKIVAHMNEIAAKREATQPIRSRTGGSTFRNPQSGSRGGSQSGSRGGSQSEAQKTEKPIKKAWALIDEAGCRGLRKGDAQMSEQHCNFIINHGTASASDIETLGEDVRARVKSNSGVFLEWEIKRIGEASQ